MMIASLAEIFNAYFQHDIGLRVDKRSPDNGYELLIEIRQLSKWKAPIGPHRLRTVS